MSTAAYAFPEANNASAISKQNPSKVMLADGSWISLTGMNSDQLRTLQWEQEQQFARVMQHVPPNSRDRTLIVGQAYDTVCTILAAQQTDEEPFVMGFDKRYGKLVLDLLYRQVNRGFGRPRLFEIGYGSGALFKTVAEHGFPVSGVEISAAMRKEAIATLGTVYADELLLGDLRSVDPVSFGRQTEPHLLE